MSVEDLCSYDKGTYPHETRAKGSLTGLYRIIELDSRSCPSLSARSVVQKLLLSSLRSGIQLKVMFPCLETYRQSTLGLVIRCVRATLCASGPLYDITVTFEGPRLVMVAMDIFLFARTFSAMPHRILCCRISDSNGSWCTSQSLRTSALKIS